jgi:hypothetical protein
MSGLMQTPNHELLTMTFGRVNPVFFARVMAELGGTAIDYRDRMADKVRGLAFPPKWLGYDVGSPCSPAVESLQNLYGEDMKNELADVCHVFPVWCEDLASGMMVPIDIELAEDWHISDAFARFHFLDGEHGNPLLNLLKVIELVWKKKNPGEILPLRWRQPLNMRIMCPIHMEAIDGNSLHVPLIVSVLRALAVNRNLDERTKKMPFGNCPVFATGTLRRDRNTFGKVERVEEKLTGFVREYGEGLPALLQAEQIQLLPAELLCKVAVQIVNSLEDLLKLPEFAPPLKTLCEPIHPGEIDTCLQVMSLNRRALRFDDVADMTQWLASSLKSPVYLFQLYRQAGLVLAHTGALIDAASYYHSCQQIFFDNRNLFGLDDLCDLATMAGVIAVDSLQSSLADSLFAELEPMLPLLPVKKRVAYWGTRCQLFHIEQQFDDAVRAGGEAVALADLGMASDSGRERNYLIHALLARARMSGKDQGQQLRDIQTATQLLIESKGYWAPCDDVSNRHSHLSFCLHYEAELARLEHRIFALPDMPPWTGYWGHAWYFALHCCSRNLACDLLTRQGFADKLASAIASKRSSENRYSLFFMLRQIYQIHAAYLGGRDYADHLQNLRHWCEDMEEAGFPGWNQRFKPCLEALAIEPNVKENVEMLCDLVPYH